MNTTIVIIYKEIDITINNRNKCDKTGRDVYGVKRRDSA